MSRVIQCKKDSIFQLSIRVKQVNLAHSACLRVCSIFLFAPCCNVIASTSFWSAKQMLFRRSQVNRPEKSSYLSITLLFTEACFVER